MGPGSRTRHDSTNQTRFQILNQGPASTTIVVEYPIAYTVQRIVKFGLPLSCCYFSEFYQVSEDDKLHIHESLAKYKPSLNAYFFSKTQSERMCFMS